MNEIEKIEIFRPDGKPDINHIDLNKTNNNVTNLEWVTKKENSIHCNALI